MDTTEQIRIQLNGYYASHMYGCPISRKLMTLSVSRQSVGWCLYVEDHVAMQVWVGKYDADNFNMTDLMEILCFLYKRYKVWPL
jgi:hypothetical protein